MSSFGDLNRVNTNIQSLNSQLSLNRINRDLAQSQLRMSTGLRINRAEDDAAGYSTATKLNSRVEGLTEALRNVGDAKGVLDIAESSFDAIIDNLIEMKGLATRAGNDTLGEKEREDLGKQIAALANDVNEIADQTVYMDYQLLNGGNSPLELTFLVGERAEDILETSISEVAVNTLFTAGSSALADPARNDAVGEVGSFNVENTGATEVIAATAGGSVTVTAGGIGEITVNAGTAGAAYNDLQISINFAADNTLGATAAYNEGVITVTLGTDAANYSAADIEAAIQGIGATAGLVFNHFEFGAEEAGGVDREHWDGVEITLSGGLDAAAATAGSYSFDVETNFVEGETFEFSFGTASFSFTFGEGGVAVGEDASETAENLAAAINEDAAWTATASDGTITITEATASDDALASGDLSVTGALDDSDKGSLDFASWDASDFRNFLAHIDSAIDGMTDRVNDIGISQSSLSVREETLSRSISANMSAVSRIMDTDFAKEQSESIRLQILQQTATSALAQANFGPQSVLGFL